MAAGEARPSDRAERAGAWVACGGERGGEEDEVGAGADGGDETGGIVRGGGGGGAAIACTRAGAAAQVQPGVVRRGGAPIAGDHEFDPPGAADGGDAVQQGGAIGRGIVAEHHAAEASWQGGDQGQQVGLALFIGEQP